MASVDLMRILKLPVFDDLTEAEDVVATSVLAGSDFKLFPVQTKAIASFLKNEGLLAPIGVGEGKTFICLTLANLAALGGIQRSLLLVPPSCIPQLFGVDLKMWRSRFDARIQIHNLGTKNKVKRRTLARSNLNGLYVMPYSMLSSREGFEDLVSVRPELIICDEADALCNKHSARTKRLFSYIKAAKPLGACLSGTFTATSIKDYAHLAEWCLGLKSPIPIQYNTLTMLADGVDATKNQINDVTRALCEWAGKGEVRDAFEYRLRSAPGVVCSAPGNLGSSLVLSPRDCGPISAEHMALLEKCALTWTTPDGDEIDHAIHFHRLFRELCHGFYHRLRWPDEREDNKDILERSKQYHAIRNDYHRELRAWFKAAHRPGFDTPFLVGRGMAKGEGPMPEDLRDLWKELKAADFPGRIERISTPVFIDRGRAKAAAKIAAELISDSKNPVIWFYNEFYGQAILHELSCLGIEAKFAPAGADKWLAALSAPGEGKRPPLVASIMAHGRGKNLQHHWDCAVFAQFPRSAKLAEQALGRVHRTGQKAAEVEQIIPFATGWEQELTAAAINDALYIQQTTGVRQKLIYGTWSSFPKLFSSAYLADRGWQPSVLSVSQEAFKRERFTASAME